MANLTPTTTKTTYIYWFSSVTKPQIQKIKTSQHEIMIVACIIYWLTHAHFWVMLSLSRNNLWLWRHVACQILKTHHAIWRMRASDLLNFLPWHHIRKIMLLPVWLGIFGASVRLWPEGLTKHISDMPESTTSQLMRKGDRLGGRLLRLTHCFWFKILPGV